MAGYSKIEWTECTWNPVTGCTKISEGCANCYAFTMAKRLTLMGNQRYVNGFDVTLHNDLVDLPLTWKKPRMIFVNSMSDLFHEDIPDNFILDVFKTMNKANWHTFQVLTKRAERMAALSSRINWTSNIWQGVTVEGQKYVDRIDMLRTTGATVKFISFEPLISSINNIDLQDINWAIVGGESGYGARPMKEEWVLNIKNECIAQNVPFFFKQWGGFNKKKNGRELEGRIWNEYPTSLKRA